VVLVGVHSTCLVGCHNEVGEGVNMVGDVAEGPTFDLDGAGVEVFDFDIFIRFVGTTPIVENCGDLDVPGNYGRLLGGNWSWLLRGVWSWYNF